MSLPEDVPGAATSPADESRGRGQHASRLTSLTTPTGLVVSLLRMTGTIQYDVPVLLTHGTFSNGGVCAGLAGYLADGGFGCSVLEWRGHGQSGRGPGRRVTFEDYSTEEIPAAIDAVRRATGQREFFLIGHSGGGLVFLMYLARHPEIARHCRGIVTLASQATGAATTWRGRATVLRIALIANLGARARRWLRLGPEDEYPGVINQWVRWNWWRQWRAGDGFDYLGGLQHLTMPALCLAGAGDCEIAPPGGCRRLFEALGSSDKRFVLCSSADGFTENYTHARLIVSRPAKREIWPLIFQWLTDRA